MPNTQCPICSTVTPEAIPVPERGSDLYKCPRCGDFIFDRHIKSIRGFEESKKLISAWIRRQNKLGIEYPSVAELVVRVSGLYEVDKSKLMEFPQNVIEKLDALLKAYAEIVKDDYEKLVKIGLFPQVISYTAAKDIDEIKGLNQLLQELEYIRSEPPHPNMHIRITAKGWFRIDELSKVNYDSDSAFIALWYDDSLEAYLSAVIEAVTYCGYKPIVIKDIEFNNFIMDEVVSLIRQSRFVIADLTCKPEIDEPTDLKVKQGVRGGVYWEAGFAYGMGKTVIQTCEQSKDSERRIHFDLDQYHTIYWKQDELGTEIRNLSTPIENPNFAEKLAQRIKTTVGNGGYTLP